MKHNEATLRDFSEEAGELLINMEDALLAAQDNGSVDREDLDAIFRAAHTIKGGSGLLGFNRIVAFTHVAENVLDDVREGKLTLTPELIEIFLACKDYMQALVQIAIQDGNDTNIPDNLSEQGQNLIAQLERYLSSEVESLSSKNSLIMSNSGNNIKSGWLIDIKPDLHLFHHGMDPASFIEFLGTKGAIVSIKTNIDAIPDIRSIQPIDCYVSWRIEYQGNQTQAEIEDIFSYIKNDSIITITELGGKKTAPTGSAHQDHKVAKAKETTQGKNSASTTAINAEDANKQIGKARSIRVDADKIDILINQIGEMVIANATVVQQSNQLRDTALIESVAVVSRMLEEIRESAMKVRMVQIGETFNRFKRIVHDIAQKLGKEVRLEISGGDTELDKTVVEKIADPLVHMVRNAMDHGLEPTEGRRAAGKSVEGLIKLNAYHEAGSIAIEIIDDGRGLDEDKIFAKAIEKGIIEPTANLSKEEIHKLIFAPGFSTAAEVTDLSGRGVGMDVVRRNIEELRGIISIESEKGKGSHFTIRLPLTLAIIDGFLVKVGQNSYVIPLEMVTECLELTAQHRNQMQGNNYINLRGSLLPLLRVKELFEESGESRRNNIVVVQFGNHKMGLLVDELHGEFQTVIKPLGKYFRNQRWLSGATILGSGEVGLILDIQSLGNYVTTLVNTSRTKGSE
jgi:two-component system chemotaxis sensor kinase CheA